MKQVVAAVILFATLLLCRTIGADDLRWGRWSGDKAPLTVETLRAQLVQAEDEAIRLLSENDIATNNRTGVVHAMRYLGMVRSVKAIPVLCDRLLFLTATNNAAEVSEYPASDALVEIGIPAVRELLNRIATSDTTPEYSNVARRVICQSCGRNLAEAAISEFRYDKDPIKAAAQRAKLNAFKRQVEELAK